MEFPRSVGYPCSPYSTTPIAAKKIKSTKRTANETMEDELAAEQGDEYEEELDSEDMVKAEEEADEGTKAD